MRAASFSQYLSLIVASATIFAAAPIHAGEVTSIHERLVAARSQDDFAQIYRGIERESGGDTTRIVKSLRDRGFSCSTGTGYIRANCAYAYCGDRSLILLFRRELMNIGVYITEHDVSTAVVSQP